MLNTSGAGVHGPGPVVIAFLRNKTSLEPQPRIDPKFVNNPELSDVSFRVESRIFYAHKLVLVTASPRFQSMLNSRFCEGSPPVLQINDIRYDIFQGQKLLVADPRSGLNVIKY